MNACARQFGVDGKTLQRRKDGKSTHRSGGLNKLLSEGQKEALLQYIKTQAYAGFPVTASIIFAIVENWREQARLNPPSNEWMKAFLREHRNDFHIIKMKPMDGKRIAAQNPTVCSYHSYIYSF
jgi:hypothetical protein